MAMSSCTSPQPMGPNVSRTLWTPAEELRLRQCWQEETISAETLETIFPGRSLSAIQAHARKVGLDPRPVGLANAAKTSSRKHWSAAEDRRLLGVGMKMGWGHALIEMEFPGRSRAAIRRRLYELTKASRVRPSTAAGRDSVHGAAPWAETVIDHVEDLRSFIVMLAPPTEGGAGPLIEMIGPLLDQIDEHVIGSL